MAHSSVLSARERLVGTWMLVSFESVGAAGERRAVLGAQPKGIFMLDGNGHYALVLADPTRPKFKSDLRTQTTPEEYAAAAKGFISQYGTWSFDEASMTLTRKLDAGLNPNSAGTEQKTILSFSGDEMKVVNAGSTITGGATEQVYRRAI